MSLDPSDTDTVPDLEAHLGYWLRAVSNAVSQEFARRLAAEDVSVAEWVFLRALLDADGLAPSLLADRMGLTRGAITKLGDRLAARGLVARAGNPDDRRGQTLSLTAAGRQKVPALAAIADGNDADFFGVLAPADRQALDAILRFLARAHGLTTVPVD